MLKIQFFLAPKTQGKASSLPYNRMESLSVKHELFAFKTKAARAVLAI